MSRRIRMLKLRRLTVATIAAAFLGASIGSAIPARAATTLMNGGGTWAGTAFLYRFPCPSGCSATFNGYFGGAINVTDGNHIPLYQAVWPSDASLTMNLTVPVNYSDQCGSVPLITPIDGFASGTFTITGGVVSANGAVIGS